MPCVATVPDREVKVLAEGFGLSGLSGWSSGKLHPNDSFFLNVPLLFDPCGVRTAQSWWRQHNGYCSRVFGELSL